jgi:ergothioneine biosynthesis protein EgtB
MGAMLAEQYRAVRSLTTALAAPLSEEDSVVQSMPDASPTKWHLAHTTWFFENFVLSRAEPGYRPFHPQYAFLFNSYYDAVGSRHPRPERGLLTRPRLAEVRQYREHVDEAMLELLARSNGDRLAELVFIVTLGLHHEQQHQELLLTDIQHAFSRNPTHPAYRAPPQVPNVNGSATPLTWKGFPQGLYPIGHRRESESFAFDNEAPRHRVFFEAFSLGSRLVTNAEYAEFRLDGGYARPELWLSDGWAAARAGDWRAPLYWEASASSGEVTLQAFTLYGLRPIDPHAPVCHVSYYEADAYARWAGARLATEAEWEIVAEKIPVSGNLVEQGRLEPVACVHPSHDELPAQMFGDVWEWTQSPYVAYPGFVPFTGDLGEYNGKFMCNQMVLRGGSCLTSQSHIRATYRNFFPPDARWQSTGIRLARPR